MDISKHWKNIIDTLRDGIIKATNPAAERLTGYTRAEFQRIFNLSRRPV